MRNRRPGLATDSRGSSRPPEAASGNGSSAATRQRSSPSGILIAVDWLMRIGLGAISSARHHAVSPRYGFPGDRHIRHRHDTPVLVSHPSLPPRE